MNFYMFGLQRSGTNFTFLMLDMNFQGMHQVNLLEQPNDSPIWKHLIQPKPDWTPEYPIITISKNPYTWHESIKKRNSMDFFQSHTWQRYNPDFPLWRPTPNPHTGEIIHGSGSMYNTELSENISKAYNRHMERWVLDNDWDRYHIRYEDLLVYDSRMKILDELQSKYNLTWKDEGRYKIPEPGAVINSTDYTSSRTRYYLEEAPIELPPHYIKFINEYVTDRVMNHLGYKRHFV